MRNLTTIAGAFIISVAINKELMEEMGVGIIILIALAAISDIKS